MTLRAGEALSSLELSEATVVDGPWVLRLLVDAPWWMALGGWLLKLLADVDI